MAKRANGEGSVYQRASDGRWSASISVGKGKRKHFLGATQAEVMKLKNDALKAQQDGLPVRLERQNVERFLANWLDGARP